MRLPILAILATAALACAHQTEKPQKAEKSPTGILPFGRGVYTVSYSSRSSAADARNAAIIDAIRFCELQGKMMEPEKEFTTPGIRASYELVFHCDPDEPLPRER